MFGPIFCKPGASKNYKTGSWRSTHRPKFLQENCIGCGLCKLVCPEECIKGEEKNKYEVDLEFCKGCGLCAYICPKKDIVMEPEK